MKWLLFAVVILLAGKALAQSGDDFYFPAGKLTGGKTYVYVNQKDTTERSYWKLRSIIAGRDTILESKIYDKDRRQNEYMAEKIIDGNASIQSYTIYRYDGKSDFATTCVIEDSLVYKKHQRKDEKIQWRVSFLDPLMNKLVYLQKVRTLRSETASERSYKDRMTYFDINGNTLYSYTLESVYRKGVGLISYKMNLPDGRVKDFRLVE